MKVTLSIGYPGKQEFEVDIDDDEWNECETEEQQEELKFNYAQDQIWQHLDLDMEIID
ncbi:MAG: hypothetical protein F6K48_03360 [Okeania sp. SIO3H1]|nr:hypothetical protein [Okeania sp. SIO3H1]